DFATLEKNSPEREATPLWASSSTSAQGLYPMPVNIGYARVSTTEQHLDVQLQKLHAVGCHPIFKEKRSGTDDTRPVLAECLRYIRRGEALVVTRLDRLARSLHHL